MLIKNLDEIKQNCSKVVQPKIEDEADEVLPSKSRYMESSHVKLNSNMVKEALPSIKVSP
jgi:hypothetical protein